MRICLIGPSYPFRGGLAHYTTLLYRHLRQRHEVTFYAFYRQYPRWLFPGHTDRDLSERPLCEEGVTPILDSVNPLTWWDIVRRIRQQQPTLVIFPWWTSFWTPQFWTIATLVRRTTDAKILFLCHNVVDHESHRLSSFCTRSVLRRGDYFFVHSGEDRTRVERLLPNRRVIHVFHPLYDCFNTGDLSKETARTCLGLQGAVLLFFGFIRPYKGLRYLIDAMPEILRHQDATLLVVGEFWENRRWYVERLRILGVEKAVRLIEGYLPNEEIGSYFAAADLVVLPYVSSTGSGIVQIAYGFEKPVVATRVGGLPDVVEDGRTGFLVEPRDPKALADAVARFFREEKAEAFARNIRRVKPRFSWDYLVRAVEALPVS